MKMTCPKCKTEKEYSDGHRDAPYLCIKCGNLMKMKEGVPVSLTEEELAAIPKGEMDIYVSLRAAFTDPEPPYYENTVKE